MHIRRIVWLVVCSAPLAVRAAESDIDFQRDVRPLLSDACFACHGPDPEHREADLRLDVERYAKEYAIIPFRADDSEVMLRILTSDADQQMPPPDSGKQLDPEQIGLLRKWIADGAEWSDHWAFVPPKRPRLPATVRAQGSLHPIDAFVLARLEREGLSASPRADRATLLRRLSLDLIGLPPTPEELDAFLADERPGAYQRQVARLLASPHYGERWGRIWLDAARYADSNGYEKDAPRQMWAYRDWVIRQLNDDLPYDQFIIHQIAGDLLAARGNPPLGISKQGPRGLIRELETTRVAGRSAAQDLHVATGFLRNSMINEEGGADPEQFRMEAMFDRMEAIGRGILGLTVQCAQCHSHKYDPLTQVDYYRLLAFLNRCEEAHIPVHSPEELRQIDGMFRKIAAIDKELQRQTPDWSSRMAEWERTVRESQPTWEVLTPIRLPFEGQKFHVLEDDSILSESYAPPRSASEFDVETASQGITGFRLELLLHPQLPRGGPGRSLRGTGAVTEFEVFAAPKGERDKRERVKLVSATADVNPEKSPQPEYLRDIRAKDGDQRVTGAIALAIDNDVKTAWSIDVGPGRTNQPRKAVFVAEKPFGFPAGTVLTFKVNMSHGGWNGNDNHNCLLGRYRFSLTTTSDPVADPVPQHVRKILEIAPDQRTAEETNAVFRHWRSTAADWHAANQRIERLWKQYPTGTSQLVLQARESPRTTHLLARGDFLQPQQAVQPGTPEFLHPLSPGDEPPRLKFARWLVDPRSPTAARAIVNRIWQAYFGVGLVETSEDLGSQGSPASHPRLLDWLAVELMDSGWSLKHLHEQIVTSATYQQSSRSTPELRDADPYNRLLARGARFRVDAEVVRDIALAASGLLNAQIGGPSVHPPAPAFLFEPPASYGHKTWDEATDRDRYRRALYTFRFRSVPYPMLETFDAPVGNTSCVRRSRSNTPLQALTSLNEPLFLECARALAHRTLERGGDTDTLRVTYATRCCVSRSPEPDEVATLQRLLDRQRDRIRRGELDAAAIVGDSNDDSVDQDEHAAWTLVARVLLNLDETITRE